uniref:Uncharacterized LOC100187132 n=1 Tax=Ciona intestinalis TaxID=7719 RepID=F6UPH4_CIOIN|nr:uncharacterized protein LOC100187132 [Ciona intestinalis]|eukprot:XP_002131028.1 uncharacterized protein LOC100187132 [Ciona intestinalis]
MSGTLVYVTFLVLALLQGNAQAREVCATDPDHALICPDYYSSIGFCCNYQNGYYQNCCTYTAVWGLWYFWFCLVSFFFIVGGVVALCKYCATKNNSSRNSSIADTETAAVPVVFSAQQAPPVQAKVSDFPPSYDQLQHQGLDAQTQQFNSYGSSQPPYPPAETINPEK